MKVAIIGGGAAGFFAAISCKQHHPDAQVHILEKTRKTLGKVKISGGGRCNVTHACKYTSELIKFYPRGGNQLKKVFSAFGTQATIQWFEDRGVQLKTESDGRMFPTSDQSQTIIDALWAAVKKHNIAVLLSHSVSEILPQSVGFKLTINDSSQHYDKVILATGGHPKSTSYDWLRALDIDIIEPVPSLFTLNIPKTPITALMGVVVQASVRIPGSSFIEEGPILITHWGLSGPAVLRLSAWAARYLSEQHYQFEVGINWIPAHSQEVIKEQLQQEPLKKLKNNNPFQLPARFWIYILTRSGIDPEQTWESTRKTNKNKLVFHLSQDAYQVKGKTTFKEEFVTCGGVDLKQVNMTTMESTKHSGLYFAGELLNIDAVTGGFNFQAAWSTGYVAGKLKK